MRQFLYLSAAHPLGGDYGGVYAGNVYTCPTCGDTWGKLVLSNLGHWRILSWPCAAHGNSAQVGGSFLKTLVWWGDKTESTPAKTLERCSLDFLRHEAEIRITQLLKGKP